MTIGIDAQILFAVESSYISGIVDKQRELDDRKAREREREQR